MPLLAKNPISTQSITLGGGLVMAHTHPQGLPILCGILVLLAPALVLQAAPVSFQVGPSGVVSFSDSAPLTTATISMHGPGWSQASIASGGKASRAGDVTTGELPLPANCQGSLHYTVTTSAAPQGAKLDYALDFSAATDIQGAYVSFSLPCARFEGRRATLPPEKTEYALPKVGEPGLSGNASAFTADLGDGTSLVIASDVLGSVMVQDNRQFGAKEYEVRFHLFQQGRVMPGLQGRRSFHVAVLPAAEVEKVVTQMTPPFSLDLTKPFVLMQSKGELRLGTRDETLLSAKLAIHGLNWTYAEQTAADAQASGTSKARFVVGSLAVPGGGTAVMNFTEAATAEPDGSLGLRYRLSFPEAVPLNGYQTSFSLSLSKYAGEPLLLQTPDGPKESVIPTTLKENFLYNGKVSRIEVAPGKPYGFVLAVDQPSSLLIQDGRGWGGTDVELRFNFRRQEEGGQVPAGETIDRTFTFTLNSPLQIVLNEAAATNKSDTTDWFAYTLPWDSAPVSVAFLNDKPAGKHGFVTVRDGKFVLSDTGEPIRFWGTCFSAGANFPSHDQAEKIARRLADFGVNIVRTHHADAPWAERHFFKKTADNTREFDPENLDRFDYLVYCLEREGIYIYLDQLVNRYFKTGDGVDKPGELGACGKPYSNFDPRLIELQKEFSHNLWTHVNPYTKLAYKDDPGIAMMEFANENDLFTQQVTLEPYRTRFEAMYRDWARRNGVTLPPEQIDFRRMTDSLMRFLVEVQRNYYLEMRRYLREEVGVRVPMTGSNWSRNAGLLASLRDMAYTDSHTYWNHPSDGAVANRAMVGGQSTFFGGLAFNRLAGKPFFVSEWDEPWPNEWRAELPCWMGAMSALQDWNGLTVYTYRHSSSTPIEHLSGAFETFNDPARFGLFPHAALMFRRGDVSVAKEAVQVQIPLDLAQSAASPAPWGVSPYNALVEQDRIEGALVDTAGAASPAAPGTKVLQVSDKPATTDDLRQSDTGQIWRSVKQRIGKINSPRSQAVFGYLGDVGAVSTDDLTVTCRTPFATLALSSLSDSPIRTSERLLLTTVGRAENTGLTYNLMRTKAVSSGKGPILCEPIRAQVSIRTTQRDMEVWTIGADGKRLKQVPTRYEAGQLIFEVGTDTNTLYYELSVPEPA
ncbi:hypothetical protein LLH03_11515 [bacterium]|nr:hypothetical protein [bacterium]